MIQVNQAITDFVIIQIQSLKDKLFHFVAIFSTILLLLQVTEMRVYTDNYIDMG